MSRQTQVLLALRALFSSALPLAGIEGFDQETATAKSIGPGGQVTGFPGDPGEPEIDLCPPTYNYRHSFPFEMVPGPSASDDAALDEMLGALGAAIEADPTLGGLVDWIEATAPTRNDSDEDGAPPFRFAAGELIVSYASTHPLT